MASIADYLEQKDELEEEIVEAAEGHEEREQNPDNSFQIPERFRDKSPEEIARSYVELEKAYSRQGNDLGEMRKTFDEYIRLQAQSSSQTQDDPQKQGEEKPVTIDDLYEDPEGAVGRVVNKQANSRIEKLEKELERARLDTALGKVEEKFPGWREKVQTPEFINFVKESPYRTRLAAQADSYDLDALEELLSIHSEYDSAGSRRSNQKRDKDLQNASLESAGGGVAGRVEKFSRRDLMKKRIAAKQGDYEAAEFLKLNADSIAIAYEEGRITD
jgi:hypothetical protein